MLHENVIEIYGVTEANGLPYLVMPYARGPSIQQRIDDGGQLSNPELLRIGHCRFLRDWHAAHEEGVSKQRHQSGIDSAKRCCPQTLEY